MKTCPFCQKEMELFDTSNWIGYSETAWRCPTIIEQPDGLAHHYVELRKENEVVTTHIHLPPFLLTSDYEENISIIRKKMFGGNPIIQLPLIHFDTEDNLIKRIKMILLFL